MKGTTFKYLAAIIWLGLELGLELELGLGLKPGLARATPPANAKASTSIPYTWYDGTKKRIFYLSTAYVGVVYDKKTTNSLPLNAPKSLIPQMGKIARQYPSLTIYQLSRPQPLSDKTITSHIPNTVLLPMFAENPGEFPKITLPGGVIVFFHQSIDQKKIKAWSDKEKIILDVELPHPTQKIWVIKSPPGLASLTLANRLTKQTMLVQKAIPNWLNSAITK